MRISTDLWFEKASTKAEAVVQDPEDRKLLNPETYDLIHAVDYPHMAASGIYGDYVEIEAFQQLGDRFLMAWELIKTMESNNPETPNGSPRDCDTCRHWGGWSKNCGFCHNRSKWEGRSTPAPAAPSEEGEIVTATDGTVHSVIPSDRALAEKLHEMWEDYTDDVEENALRIAIYREEALRSQLARKDEALKNAACWLGQVLRHLRATNDARALSLTNDLEAIRAALHESDGRKGE